MAYRHLERAIEISKDLALLADAWFWLSEISQDASEKRNRLENALAYDLHHAQARRSLALLDGKLSPAEIIDPNNLPQSQTLSPQNVDSERFSCPKCGGRMIYTPDGSNLICEYCNRPQSIGSKALVEEQDFIVAMATARGHRPPTLMSTFKCQGCGAEFMLAHGILSIDCSFCGSAHVVALDSLRELVEPDCILPMVVQQSQASDHLNDWLLKNHIDPENSRQVPHGLYLPVWTFDIGGRIAWFGEKIQNKKSSISRARISSALMIWRFQPAGHSLPCWIKSWTIMTLSMPRLMTIVIWQAGQPVFMRCLWLKPRWMPGRRLPA